MIFFHFLYKYSFIAIGQSKSICKRVPSMTLSCITKFSPTHVKLVLTPISYTCNYSQRNVCLYKNVIVSIMAVQCGIWNGQFVEPRILEFEFNQKYALKAHISLSVELFYSLIDFFFEFSPHRGTTVLINIP